MGIETNQCQNKHEFILDCHGQCSDSAPCNTGERCLDNNCCFCSGEEYSLVLKNLTMSDAGLYRCLLNTSNHEPVKELDFQLDIVETGLAPNFHENFTYNFTDCCRREGFKNCIFLNDFTLFYVYFNLI